MKIIKTLIGLSTLSLLTMLSLNTAHAKLTFCVFDLVGTQGDVYALMKDYQLASKQWGANIELKAYTDERVLTEDFKAGKCDGASITGMRGRQFNSFTGSID
ncbi:hypothetical protein SAMN05421749_1149 [Acinetobacter marinus]|uniref:RND type efflux pump n=1 Tax=Acinetobacter marinus TaxID=281375 RepID=A0A1G6PBI5_9GAMM|nr:hypothetical protein SAMN05421749_1149 [Acinetobacter marinus]